MKLDFKNCCMTLVLLLLSGALFSGPSLAESLLKEGETLPTMELTTPTAKGDQQYLGVSDPTFKLEDIDAKVIVIEIIGVYCPYCYEQAPLFRNLFNRLQKGKLKHKVKMFAIAAGGTAMEVDHLRKEGQYNYPLVQDPKYDIHKILGEPRTPYTMLVDNKGKLLFAHQGIIKDIDSFYERISKLAE